MNPDPALNFQCGFGSTLFISLLSFLFCYFCPLLLWPDPDPVPGEPNQCGSEQHSTVYVHERPITWGLQILFKRPRKFIFIFNIIIFILFNLGEQNNFKFFVQISYFFVQIFSLGYEYNIFLLE